MATTKSPNESASAVSASARPQTPTALEPATAADFRESFGEDLRQVLDVTGGRLGEDLAQEYPRIEAEVREALAQEDEDQRRIRTEVFPKLMDPASAPMRASGRQGLAYRGEGHGGLPLRRPCRARCRSSTTP
jgi:hypothetical protein